MASTFIKLPPEAGGGGGGAVDSFNARTGNVVSQAGDYSATLITNSPSGNIGATTVQGAINELDSEKQATITASNNQYIYQNNSGVIEGVPGLFRDLTTGGMNLNLPIEPNNGSAGIGINTTQVDFEPLVNSPNESYNFHNNQVNVDPNNSGLQIGTAARLITFINNSLNHVNTSDIGEIAFIQNYFNVGNGTDPISIRGFAYSYGFGDINPNVTINGPIQGYGFQPVIDSGAIIDASVYANPFYDFATVNEPIGFYTSFSASPTLSEINNNANYTGLNLNPTVTTFTGNASFTGIGIAGNLGTFGTGSVTGINISPTVTSVTNATGLTINMSNVTGTNVKAMEITGDVSINGALSFTGALSIGELTAYHSENIVDGGGTPTSLHSLISAPIVPDNATIANADTIGVNTASLMQFGSNSTVTTNLVGIAALGLPAVVMTETGSSVDLVTGATFAISLDMTSTGGTIDQVSLCRSVAVPNGITTVTNLIGYEFTLPFGDPGTNTWAFYSDVDVPSYYAGSILVGPNDTPTNNSVGIELSGTTKALLLTRVTTTERNALTAVNGMLIYNTTNHKLEVYANGAWDPLH
ncbi:MAG: hypothetical protein FMNOHCHN_03747 [Ignavibacteriaceae bacterium]|nr:hypothetical protein [Ignavibacteriaceae bacterium]